MVGGYLRLSKEDITSSDLSLSIINQKQIVLEYAKQNNFEIYDFYIDDGYSGASFDRPAFKDMLNDIALNKIDTVITKDTSRLGRDFIETGYYIYKFFPENNIRYISILENYDSFVPNGIEDIIPFQTIINDMYLKDISKKIQSIRHIKMNEGKYMGSTVPYGYVRDVNNRYSFFIDEYSANIVKSIFKLRLEGYTSSMIARYLTNKCILPPSIYNKKNIKKTYTTYMWKSSTIDNILNNEIYIGNLVQRKIATVNYKSKKRIKLSEDKWIRKDNIVPKIIDKETFYSVQNIQNIKENTRKVKYNYILKGLVICHECKKKMIVRRKKNKKDIVPYYCCKTNVTYRNNICSLHYFKEELLNGIVIISIRKVFHLVRNRTFLIDDILNNILFKLNSSIKDIVKNTQKLRNAKDKVYKDYIKENINESIYNSLNDEIDKEIKELNTSKEFIEERKKDIFNCINDNNYKENIIKDFFYMSFISEKLLYDIVQNIEIDKKKNVYILFKFSI